jgi:hypothetical protein
MAKPETSSLKDDLSNAKNEPRRRRRRHGYRGYPNNPTSAGEIHWGSGFAGIGAMNGPRGSSGILTERTRADAGRTASDEDDETLDQ